MLRDHAARVERLRAWRRQSIRRRLLSALVVVGAVTLAARGASVVRELIIARHFGLSDSIDAFYMAYLVPSFLINVIAGSVASALVPTYIRVREARGVSSGQQLTTAVLIRTIALLLAFSIALGVAFPFVLPVLASSFDASKRTLTEHLFFVMLPSETVSGIAALCSPYIKAGERFAHAAAVPAITPLVVVASLLAAGSRASATTLAIAIVAGAVLEAAALAVAIRRRAVPTDRADTGAPPETAVVVRQYVPVAVGAVFMSSTLIVDQALAASLGAGKVAALNYGSRIVTFGLGVAAIALGSAATPYFSSLLASHDWHELRHTFNSMLRLVFLVSVPATLVLVAVSKPLVRTVYEGGTFTSHDTSSVARVQELFALQIPFYLAGIVAVRLVSALRENTLLLKAAAVNAFVNGACDYAFMRLWGLPGIALSTSVVYLVSCAFLIVGVRAILRRSEAIA
jgi:putative peptidoglycan lipid II flippase